MGSLADFRRAHTMGGHEKENCSFVRCCCHRRQRGGEGTDNKLSKDNVRQNSGALSSEEKGI